MTRADNMSTLKWAPRWILAVTGAYLVLGFLALCVWRFTRQVFDMQVSSSGSDSLAVTGMAAIEVWLCVLVLRSFPRGSALRPAWLLILLSAAFRTVCSVLAQFLGTNWLLNPLAPANGGEAGLLERIRWVTLVIDGPVQMALLAAGLLMALRVFRKFGFQARLGAVDWVLAGSVGLFTLYRFGQTAVAFVAGQRMQVDDVVKLAGLPFLCLLFLEAALLRRSAARMGRGLVAKCWTAFAAAIFLITFGQVATWMAQHSAGAWPTAAFEWYLWFPAAAALALAPAYQIAAVRSATDRGTPAEEGLPARRRLSTATAN